MKSLLLFILFAVSVSAFANAGIFRGNGRTVVMDSSNKIQMVEEEVVMIPMRGNYPVDSSCRNLDPMTFHSDSPPEQRKNFSRSATFHTTLRKNSPIFFSGI